MEARGEARSAVRAGDDRCGGAPGGGAGLEGRGPNGRVDPGNGGKDCVSAGGRGSCGGRSGRAAERLCSSCRRTEGGWPRTGNGRGEGLDLSVSGGGPSGRTANERGRGLRGPVRLGRTPCGCAGSDWPAGSSGCPTPMDSPGSGGGASGVKTIVLRRWPLLPIGNRGVTSGCAWRGRPASGGTLLVVDCSVDHSRPRDWARTGVCRDHSGGRARPARTSPGCAGLQPKHAVFPDAANGAASPIAAACAEAGFALRQRRVCEALAAGAGVYESHSGGG